MSRHCVRLKTTDQIIGYVDIIPSIFFPFTLIWGHFYTSILYKKNGFPNFFLPFSSLKIRKLSECWWPKYCPTIRLEYFRTNSKYRWLNLSCSLLGKGKIIIQMKVSISYWLLTHALTWNVLLENNIISQFVLVVKYFI